MHQAGVECDVSRHWIYDHRATMLRFAVAHRDFSNRECTQPSPSHSRTYTYATLRRLTADRLAGPFTLPRNRLEGLRTCISRLGSLAAWAASSRMDS
jgi:hypothetical protein